MGKPAGNLLPVHRCGLVQVLTGAEGARALAGKHHGAHVVAPVEVAKRCNQPGTQFRIHRVHSLGPIQRDQRDRVRHGHFDGILCHILTPAWRGCPVPDLFEKTTLVQRGTS